MHEAGDGIVSRTCWTMLTLEYVEDGLHFVVNLRYEGRVGDTVDVSQARRRDRYS